MPVKKHSHVLLLLCCWLAGNPLHAQNDTILPVLRATLLSGYGQLQQNDTINNSIACTYNTAQTRQQLLALAHQFDLLGNPACARAVFQQLEKEKSIAKKDLLQLLLGEAEYLNAHQLYDNARTIALKAGQLAIKQNEPAARITSLLILSGGALKRREISSAYQWADSALSFARQSEDRLQEGKALLQMAFVARRHFTSSAHRAFPYYLQAMEVAETVNDPVTLFSSYLYYAVDNFEIGNWAEGLPYYQKAMDIVIKNNNVYQQYTACIATGYTLLQLGFRKEPLVLFSIALHISQRQQLPYNIQHSLFEISGAFDEAKQYDSALHYATLAAAVPGIDSFWANMWKVKADIYNKMGNYKMASAMYEKSIDWSNEDFLYRNQDQLSAYEAKLKTTEKELQATTEKRKRIQLQWIIGASALLLLLAAVGYLLQRKTSRKLYLQNSIIEKQRLELADSLSEKEILLKEIHHRVKNNLSVISSLLELQSAGINEPKAKAAITEAQNRVRSIALIHQRLYQGDNSASIDLHSLAAELLQQLSSLFQSGSKEIAAIINIPATLLDIDTAIPLGLIINELLTNSYKYAFNNTTNGYIHLHLTQPLPGHFVFRYADSGPGLPPGFEPAKSVSMGLRMIYRLSQQLGGDASYAAKPETSFLIRFKDSITRNQEHE